MTCVVLFSVTINIIIVSHCITIASKVYHSLPEKGGNMFVQVWEVSLSGLNEDKWKYIADLPLLLNEICATKNNKWRHVKGETPVQKFFLNTKLSYVTCFMWFISSLWKLTKEILSQTKYRAEEVEGEILTRSWFYKSKGITSSLSLLETSDDTNNHLRTPLLLKISDEHQTLGVISFLSPSCGLRRGDFLWF